MMSRGDRLALCRHVLAAMPVHTLLALAINPTALKQINRLLRCFLWHGRKAASSGHCLVNWRRVCHPIALGGLGLPDFHLAGVALRTRWLWLQKTDPSRPWQHVHIPHAFEVHAILRASTCWHIGDGRSCKFWEDHWLDGQCISDIAPLVQPRSPSGAASLFPCVMGCTSAPGSRTSMGRWASRWPHSTSPSGVACAL